MSGLTRHSITAEVGTLLMHPTASVDGLDTIAIDRGYRLSVPVTALYRVFGTPTEESSFRRHGRVSIHSHHDSRRVWEGELNGTRTCIRSR